MELLLKIVAGSVAAALCAAVLRRSAPEFAIPVILACGAWVLMTAAQSVEQAARTLGELARLARLDDRVVEPVIKVVGLSLVTRVGVEVCRSTGETGIAAFIEIAGTVLALGAAMPLVSAVVEMMLELLA